MKTFKIEKPFLGGPCSGIYKQDPFATSTLLNHLRIPKYSIITKDIPPRQIFLNNYSFVQKDPTWLLRFTKHYNLNIFKSRCNSYLSPINS